MDLKLYPYLGLPVQTCRCLRMTTSPAVNTKAIFWISSWPFHRNQHIIPFLHPMAKGGKHSIRRVEPQSCLRARWQLLLLLLELAAGWAALPWWHFSCKPMHTAEGCPQDWVCMCACMSRHAPPQQVSKAAPVQVHVLTQSCMRVSAGRRAKSPCVCLPDSLTVKSSSKNPWQGMWSPLGAGTFLHVCPWQPRYTTELLQKPTCLPSFHKTSRWGYLNSKHDPLNGFYIKFLRLHLCNLFSKLMVICDEV